MAQGRIGTQRSVAAVLVLAAALLAGLVLARPPGAAAGTINLIFTVNQIGDAPDATPNEACDVDTGTAGDQCTLRAAIQASNFNPDVDTIQFDVPGAGVHRIAPTDNLPDLTNAVTINGYTQPGASANTRKLGRGDNAVIEIELNGKNVPFGGLSALIVGSSAAGTSIRGLDIDSWPSGGIEVKALSAIQGNFIGTNPRGTKDRGNMFDGVFGFGGSATVGGPSPADRNVISANGDSGITSNIPMVIQGNYIGTASDGRSPLGNKVVNHDAAVGLYGGANTVGGPGGAANVIAFNKQKAIRAVNPGTVATLSRNRIFGNGGIAIDLQDDGPTPNDPGDADTGANGLLNFPVLTSATRGSKHTTITGSYSGFAGVEPYRIEFFANPPHTHQAKSFLRAAQIETDMGGAATFTFKVRRVPVGHTITTTAADDGGETSEVSRSVRVTPK